MIICLNHIGISVTDLDRSIRFYRDAFGMEVVVEQAFCGDSYEKILALPNAAGRVALLRNGSLQLELFEFATPHPDTAATPRLFSECGIFHFCVEVSDIESEYQRLRSMGVSFHCGPLDFCGIAKATYGRDPDDNVFELWERVRATTLRPGPPTVDERPR